MGGGGLEELTSTLKRLRANRCHDSDGNSVCLQREETAFTWPFNSPNPVSDSWPHVSAVLGSHLHKVYFKLSMICGEKSSLISSLFAFSAASELPDSQRGVQMSPSLIRAVRGMRHLLP